MHVFYVHFKFEVGPGGMRGSVKAEMTYLRLVTVGGMRGMNEVHDAFINRMASNGKLVQ